MHFLQSVLMLIFVISDESILEFIVRGSDPLVVPLGSSVVLPCYTETPLVTEKLRVVWRREDSETLVHLYEDGESRAEEQHKDYQDRAHFFTDQIQHGNFSLRLDNLTAEDKGVYRCKVYSQQFANKTLVEIKYVEYLQVSGSSRSISAYDGFSVYHITVLILCIITFGSALLFCSRPENGDMRMYLQVSLFLCLNITMVLASIIWRVIEGSLYETVCCCMLYILRTLRSFWVTPIATGVPDTILKYIRTPHADHAVFMVVIYSVLLVEHFKDTDTVIRTVFFCSLVLMCLVFITQLAKEKMLSCSGELCRGIYRKVQPLVATCSFSLLPSLQLALLLYTRFDSGAVFSVAVGLPALHWMCFFRNEGNRKILICLCFLSILIWLMMIVMSGTMIYLYILLLKNEKEGAGLVCVAGILQALWVLTFSEVPVHYLNLHKRKLFLFESAGLVLVNSVALMTEVIMIAVKGERLVGDLRIVVFPSEWLFTVLLILSMRVHWKPDSTQSQPAESGTPAPDYISIEVNKRTGESNEMEALGEAGICEEQEEELNS